METDLKERLNSDELADSDEFKISYDLYLDMATVVKKYAQKNKNVKYIDLDCIIKMALIFFVSDIFRGVYKDKDKEMALAEWRQFSVRIEGAIETAFKCNMRKHDSETVQ